MSVTRVTAGRWAAGTAILLAALLAIQVAVATAAPETFGMPPVVAQVPTPTPFRFLTPTPVPPRTTSSTTTAGTTSATAAPRAGGFPMELAVPALAGGLAAIGGGTYLLRRRTTR